jgi:regulator of cell morphogenesis and NO signaling
MKGVQMTAKTSLAELAVTHAGAARVFHRHRLDFCCGGRRPLDEVCREQGLDAAAILDAIGREDPLTPDGPAWATEPLPALIQHIVGTYHARLRDVLPELVMMADKVERRHGDKASCPRGLPALLTSMHEEVLDHLQKEEQILFPMIASGMGSRASGPVMVMEHEHQAHAENLQRVRAITAGLTPPPEACTTWRALYLGLQQLEQELMDHIHLENNILFPRALAGDIAAKPSLV